MLANGELAAVHVVDVCAFYTPFGGGVRTYVERKLAVLPRLGHRITIVVPGAADGVRTVGPLASVVSLRSPTFPLNRRYRWFNDEAALHRVLDGLEPDLIEASSPLVERVNGLDAGQVRPRAHW